MKAALIVSLVTTPPLPSLDRVSSRVDTTYSVLYPQLLSNIVHPAVLADYMLQNATLVENQISKFVNSLSLPDLTVLSPDAEKLTKIIGAVSKKQNGIDSLGKESSRSVFKRPKFLLENATAKYISELKTLETDIPVLIENVQTEIHKLSTLAAEIRPYLSSLEFERQHIQGVIEKLGPNFPDFNGILINRNFSLNTAKTLVMAKIDNLDFQRQFE